MKSVRLCRVAGLGLACLLLAAAHVHAAGNADVVGTWNMEFDEQGTTIRPTLVLSEGEGGLKGTWTGPRGTTNAKGATYEGGVLRFTLVQKSLLGERTIQFEAKVEGDTMNGTMVAPRGTVPVKGSRAAPPK